MALSIPSVVLKSGKDLALRHGHPLVFSGAIKSIEGAPQAGDAVRVIAPGGRVTGFGFYNPLSEVAVRLVGREPPSESFWRDGLRRAWQRRRAVALPDEGTDAFRLAYAEADGLPGLIVDVFANTAVVSMESPAADRAREQIGAALAELLSDSGAAAPVQVYERSDGKTRRREGLEARVGWLTKPGKQEPIWFHEYGQPFVADPFRGQKTGAYLDLRRVRKEWAPLLGRSGQAVLDVCCYSGALSAITLSHGATAATLVDQGEHALALAAMQLDRFGAGQRATRVRDNAFSWLKQEEERVQSGKLSPPYGAIVLDPPRLASSRSELREALSALENLHRRAFTLLADEGLLVSLCCTGLISQDELSGVVARAASKAGVEAIILDTYAQPPDHPVPVEYPEAHYLKGFLIQGRR